MFHFKNKEIKDLFQWSRDIVLKFDPIYAGEEVHFSNNKVNSLNKKINGNGEVTIPNILLTESTPIEVYLFIKEGSEQYTKKKKILPVIARPKPEDYIYTEEEIKIYEDLEKRIDNITPENIGAIPAPKNMQVGQIIVTKKVNEDGTPIEWETKDYTEVTEADKQAIAEKAAETVGYPKPTSEDNGKFLGCEGGKAAWLPVEASGGGDISLGLTSASVGQTIKVKAVDENGKPTEWEAADFPSGGESWRLVRKITLEENVTAIDISEDNDGNPFALKKIRINGFTLGTASGGQLRINVANKTDDSHSILGPYNNFRGLDTIKRHWYAESECFGIIGGKGKWFERYNTPDNTGVGAAYARSFFRTPNLDSGQPIQDRVEFLHIFSNTSGVEIAAGSDIELWGVDA